MFAFKKMLQYIHGVKEEWWPWSLEVREMIRIADLAERYNLHGLQKTVINHANDIVIRKDKLIEIAKLAEEFHVYTELSQTLLKTCANILLAILETPEDFNNFVQEWSGKSPEESSFAFRLLAQVDHYRMAYVYKFPAAGRVMSHLRNINMSNEPRKRLQFLKTGLEDSAGQEDDIKEIIPGNGYDIFIRSLWMCQRLDVEKAALEGVPLTLDTLVEDDFTHEMSVRLHLDIMRLSTGEAGTWDETDIEKIWTEMLRSIPEVKSIILLWFGFNGELFDHVVHHRLTQNLRSCEESIKQCPGYETALEAYQ